MLLLALLTADPEQHLIPFDQSCVLLPALLYRLLLLISSMLQLLCQVTNRAMGFNQLIMGFFLWVVLAHPFYLICQVCIVNFQLLDLALSHCDTILDLLFFPFFSLVELTVSLVQFIGRALLIVIARLGRLVEIAWYFSGRCQV